MTKPITKKAVSKKASAAAHQRLQAALDKFNAVSDKTSAAAKQAWHEVYVALNN